MFNATAQLLMEYYLPMILIIFMFTLSQIKTRGFLRSLVKFLERIWLFRRRIAVTLLSGATLTVVTAAQAFAQTPESAAGGEANLRLPDLSQVQFLGFDGHTLLTFGIIFCVFGLLFGLATYRHLKNLPVHKAIDRKSVV